MSVQYKWTQSVWNIPVRTVLTLEKWIFIWIKWREEQINSENYIYFKDEKSFPVCPFFIPSDRKRLAYRVHSCMFPVFKIRVSAKNLAAVLHFLLSLHRKNYVFDFKDKLNFSCFLCFVDRASLYNLVNKANLAQKFS
jgi:hypothetical protein